MFEFILKQLKSKKGFTLVELVVVIAILGILAAIAVPRFTGFTDKANQAVDDQTAALLKNGIQLYHAEYQKYPKNASTEMLEAVTNVFEEGKIPEPKKNGNKYFYDVNTGDVVATGSKEGYVEISTTTAP